jgi:hypothetical protein
MLDFESFSLLLFCPRSSMKSVSLLLTCLVLVAAIAEPARAYYPQHPEVREMVDKGVAFLESLSDEEIKRNKWGGEQYHIVLIAFAHLKARHDPSAPLVRRGIEQALRAASGSGSSLPTGGKKTLDKSNYELSICILLLCEADAKKYKKQIESLRDQLLARQQPSGGFGYPSEDEGITSQVQYVVLAIWGMKQNGIAVPADAVNSVLQWMIRVQDINGSWPYRAKDPGPNSGLIAQGTTYMSHSTALAGASTIVIAGDYFGLWRGEKQVELEGVLPGMPLAVRLPGKQAAVRINAGSSAVKPELILAAVDRMNQYRIKVPYESSGTEWHYYALYSLERFESFHEMAIQKSEEETMEPKWYDDGVRKLKSNQADSGGWAIKDRAQSPPAVATCFAILFLVRSTQQSIMAASTGTLAGGQGLPKDTTDIRVDGSSIKGRPVAADIGSMLDLLEEDGGELEGKSIPDDMQLAKDPQELRAQLDRLERLVRGSRSWQARRVAARLLGTSEQMRVVPALIHALSDPDPVVKRYARDGLRFISRKFDGFGLSDSPTAEEVEEVQQKWRQWYLTVNPKYVFMRE